VELLQAERAAINDAFRRGLVSEESYRELAERVDHHGMAAEWILRQSERDGEAPAEGQAK
jgi:hypothetical protein